MPSLARRLSFEILCQIEIFGAFSDQAINSAAISCQDARDRHLITEIVFGALRWQSFLDHILADACTRPWEDVEPQVRILLRMSLYQIWRLARVPEHAIVFDAVDIAKSNMRRGVDGFINGILRRLVREQPWKSPEMLRSCPPWIRVSLPEWLWVRWSKRYNEEGAREFALSLNEPPRRALRLNFASDDVRERLVPSDLVPGAYFPLEGAVERSQDQIVDLRAQDEASQLIPHLFGDILGCRVWDPCAAPGGKSAILRELVGKSGSLVSTDRRWGRLNNLTRTQESKGESAIHLVVADAGEPPPFRSPFDAVLADVPCSGLGTLRRNPEIKWRFKPEKLPLLSSKQSRILNAVAEAVRVGGKLLYSTCSTEPEENEEVIDRFLRGHGNFRLETPASPTGVGPWLDGRGLLRTFPGARQWDGFCAALMLRYS